jgi:murein DD-endopeptidase MepM/ murein hydrolase activator NlpD
MLVTRIARRAWRLADHAATASRRRRRVRLIGALLGLAAVLPLAAAAMSYVTGLDDALLRERAQRVALADSMRHLSAVIDQRVERDFDLRRVRSGEPPLPIMGRVSSGFTNRRLHPVLQLWRAHRGVDIPARTGTVVRPVVPGEVIEVGRDFGFGRYVVVRHGSVLTRYAHLQRTLVDEGTWITPETTLGTVGSTGLASSPHLHYEVLRAGAPVDPLRHEIRMVEIVPAAIRREAAPQ